MHTQRSYVCTRLARHPEYGEISLLIKFKELGFIDGPYAKLTLDGGDERGTLEESTSESLDGTRESGRVGESRVQTENGDILLT